MKIYRGFVFSKHILVGTRSEGEAFYLQTYKKDYHIISSDKPPFIHDKLLSQYIGKIVEIEGELVVKNNNELKDAFPSLEVIYVHKIKDINGGVIPKE
jgi:hypothetical protein